jgi:hypothetical protein
MKCNARIQLDKNGMAETYCQRKDGHSGEHSIRIDGAAPVGTETPQLVLPMRPAPAVSQPDDVPTVPDSGSTKAG